MDKERREEIARRVLERSKPGQTEAIVSSENFGLTRFTHNAVHQNVTETNTLLRIRAIVGQRTGVVTTNRLSADSIDDALARAVSLAQISPPDDGLVPLEHTNAGAQTSRSFFEATAAATPAQRAGMANQVFEVAQSAGVWAAGYVRTSSYGVTIANSAGTMHSFESTGAAINVKQNAADSTGYAERYALDVGDIDARAVAQHAADKALAGSKPRTMEPGAYTVIIEPAAFAELLAYLTPHFSAQTVEEGASFISRGLGVTYLGADFSLSDDFAHPQIAGIPFDYQGYPTERLELVHRGSVNNVVTDAYWARKLGTRNTGHGLPAPNGEGPQMRSIVVGGGSKSTAELIAGVERGLLITRFWYIRVVDQKRAIVTGMTRDGTFLIEGGRLRGGVKNLRFNESIINVLNNIECSSERVLTNAFDSYSAVVPSVRVDNFTFSSSAEF